MVVLVMLVTVPMETDVVTKERYHLKNIPIGAHPSQ